MYPPLDKLLPSLMSVIRLMRRAILAARLGVLFTGMSRFRIPSKFGYGRRRIFLQVPPEAGLSSDFVNVIIDDDYGLREMTIKPATIIDVGANVGLFSVWAGLMFPDAVVHAYEPNARLYPFLNHNCAQVGATVFHEGVGSHTGFASVVDHPESRLASTKPFSGGESVKITSVSDALNRVNGAVDLLKLDCEGAEWDIFQEEHLFERILEVRMEYHLVGGKSLSDLKEVFSSRGFILTHLKKNQGFGIAWFARGNRSAVTLRST
jgi:FkbM family methyltransferase